MAFDFKKEYKEFYMPNWISVIRLPDFVTEKDFTWAVETATKKKKWKTVIRHPIRKAR